MARQMQIARFEDSPIATEIMKGSDRVCAIVGGAYVEDTLKTAICAQLLDDKDAHYMLFKASGPLGPFVPKAQLGYLLGIYKKETRDELITISQIRNHFAHWAKAKTLSFGSREIRLLCEKLGFIDRIFKVDDKYQPAPKPFTQEVARDQFTRTIGIIASLLAGIGENRKDITPPSFF